MVQKGRRIGLFSKGTSDFVLWVVTILLVAFGLIMVLSASSPSSLSEVGDSYKYLRKQAMAAGIGFVGMIFLSQFDYNNFRRKKWFKWVIYIVTVALLFAVKVKGMSEGGAKRWINIMGFNFQPSEVAKVALIIFYADVLSNIQSDGKIRHMVRGLIVPLVALLPIVFCIFVLQNHFSATFIICFITIVQLFVAGVPFKNFLMLGGIATPFFMAIMMLKMGKTVGTEEENFRFQRIRTWLDPFAYKEDEGWQIIQSLYAIGSGGLFGVGLGKSKQKYLYLPEPQNDFIFAVLAEELGFFGALVVILLFVIFIWRGIMIALNAKDSFGALIAIGIVSMIGLQALVNIAVVTGTIPVTGMPLPFFSYGGTAILVNMCSVGILLNISKKNQKKS